MKTTRMLRLLPPLLLLLIVIMLAGTACAGERTTMRVTNCDEWVSLRSRPSTDAARQAKVPLGAPVIHCGEETGGFIPCEYKGKTGYILSRYLEEIDDFEYLRKWNGFDVVDGIGQPVDDFTDASGNRVLVRRLYSGDGESLCAAVYDAKLNYLTAMWSTSDEFGQFTALTAFAGGPKEEPYLLWADGENLSAYAIGKQMPDDQLWTLPLKGSGLTHAVDTDGTIYLIGYDQEVLSCVSNDGKLLWQSSDNDPDVYWPYQIDILPDRVDVTYEESGSHDGTPAVVSFSKTDGSVLGANSAQAAGDQPVLVQLADGSDIGPHFEMVVGNEAPLVQVLFTASDTVTDFEVLTLDTEITAEGEEHITAAAIGRLPSLTPQTPLLVSMSFIGDMPNNGFRFTGADGAAHSFVLELSGENGELIVRPFEAE